MKRIPEPELMDEVAQAKAYASADFEVPHNMFIDLLGEKLPNLPDRGVALDLGCGTGDITIRFAKRYPHYQVDAVDGASSMLAEAEQAVNSENMSHRVSLHHKTIQTLDAVGDKYQCIFSNSLLHHLHTPSALWDCLYRASSTTYLFVMDLYRPNSEQAIDGLVSEYAGTESEQLRQDFRNSLFAAFQDVEIKAQLQQAKLEHLSVEYVSARHVIVCGRRGLCY